MKSKWKCKCDAGTCRVLTDRVANAGLQPPPTKCPLERTDAEWMPDMIWLLTPDSSNIVKYGRGSWDKESCSVIIMFKGGAKYLYHGVPHYVYEGLLETDSVGKYIHTHLIKPKLKCLKLEG